MENNWANNFYEISSALYGNSWIREKTLILIESKNIAGKALEGGNRIEIFKDILGKLVEGEISLDEAINETASMLNRNSSMHSANNRVFPSGWEERLVRTIFSKLYNQAVLYYILDNNMAYCHVPHSSYEDSASNCSQYAGRNYNAAALLKKMEDAYENGVFTKEFKIPDHPHCTHVVRPI